ncbi:unnamed protein product [Brassica oleracea var. botrytis]|uniref:(rape) hypothetical protein n=1 Tax=Brassica napus TaxID=3708 RepID=A0A816U2H8_BRANA|nr:unnamed protein product [Brassica napus]
MLKDQKNLQRQLIAEREGLYRSKPSPSKPLGGKKAHGMSTLLGSRGMHQTPKLTRKQINVRSTELCQLANKMSLLKILSRDTKSWSVPDVINKALCQIDLHLWSTAASLDYFHYEKAQNVQLQM